MFTQWIEKYAGKISDMDSTKACVAEFENIFGRRKVILCKSGTNSIAPVEEQAQ